MINRMIKITIVGGGYVGLVSGVCLAKKGHRVTCVDLRSDVVCRLNSGDPHIHEEGLPALLRETLDAGRFSATTELASALIDCEMVLVAVGTPSVDGRIDLTAIRTVAREIGAILRTREKHLSIVIKSTVVPGTTDTVVREEIEGESGKKLGEFGLGMNPEFLREGNAVEDFMTPDRIVFGHEDRTTLELLRTLYAPFECDTIAVPTRTAEFIKYANNCLLATQISAVNELANLAAALGRIDIAQVMQGVHADKRWNPFDSTGVRVNPKILTYLLPGCGFGGSCFPKDVQALRTLGIDYGQPMRLLQAVLDINTHQPEQIISLLRERWSSFSDKHILVLGLAFKPDTDDVRESASYPVITKLVRAGAVVVVHDPHAMNNARQAWPDLPIRYALDWESELRTADAVLVLTGWRDYLRLTDTHLAKHLAGRILIDARRMFEANNFPAAEYMTIGFVP